MADLMSKWLMDKLLDKFVLCNKLEAKKSVASTELQVGIYTLSEPRKPLAA